MILLATLLTFTWPKLDVAYGPPKPAEVGTFVRVSKCCNSMSPAFRNGARIHFVAWDGKGNLLGKLVDTGAVLHQVVAENERAVKTSGMANKHSDGWVEKAKVRWVAVYIEQLPAKNTPIKHP